MSDKDDGSPYREDWETETTKTLDTLGRIKRITEAYLTSSASANSDIRIIGTLPTMPRADKERLIKVRAAIAKMTRHEIDVLEGTLSPEAELDAEFKDVPRDTLRAFIASERSGRDKWWERWTTIAGFIITNVVVILAAWMSRGS